jgi:hypothetical protein
MSQQVAGWRIDTPGSDSRETATVGNPVGMNGVDGGAEGAGFGGRAHRELVQVGLAHRDGPGGEQALDHRCIIG